MVHAHCTCASDDAGRGTYTKEFICTLTDSQFHPTSISSTLSALNSGFTVQESNCTLAAPSTYAGISGESARITDNYRIIHIHTRTMHERSGLASPARSVFEGPV